jgi:transposase-like protein
VYHKKYCLKIDSVEAYFGVWVKMKSCSHCKVEKELSEFAKRGKDKHKARCKACDANYQRERIKRIKEEGGEAYQKYLASHTKYRLDHEDYQKDYRARVKEENGQLYQTSLEQARMYKRRLQEEGGEAYQNYLEVKKNTQRRRQSDPSVRFGDKMRAALSSKIKNPNSNAQYLGTPITLIRAWLEMNFHDGMTWENYGTYWHIDHTLPLSAWNLEDEKECMLCFSWHNTRPLTRSQNLRKSTKILPYLVFQLERQLRRFYSMQNLDLNQFDVFMQQYCTILKQIMRHPQIAGSP